MEASMPKKKQSQPYTEAFRREAIRRSEEEGVTAVQVAKELGIRVNQIYNCRWRVDALSSYTGSFFTTNNRLGSG